MSPFTSKFAAGKVPASRLIPRFSYCFNTFEDKVYPAILEKNNAVEDFRVLIGATNPAEAAEGTIRKAYATSIGENAVHGSDSDENAAIESAFHFSGREVFSGNFF